MQEPVFLYVEDDKTSREVMKILLTYGLKYKHVTIFEDSSDFAERLDKLSPRPDIIFLDIHVHPYDGFHMLRMIRSHPDYQDATVVALTASVMNEEVEELRLAGFDGGMAKPINQKTFPDILNRILNGETIWHIV